MRWISAASAGLAVLLGWAGAAKGYISLSMAPVPEKVAVADSVIVGKITAVRDKTATTRPFRHMDSVMEFQVVDVAVTEVLFGPKVKEAALGFISVKLKGGQYKPAPAVGMEGIFFGAQPEGGDFLVVPSGCFVESKDADYDKTLAVARRSAKMLNEPAEGLKSKDASERILAAEMVILRSSYAPMRWWGGSVRFEPIDAEQSKQVMLALAEADWPKRDPETGLSPRFVWTWLRSAEMRTRSVQPRPASRGTSLPVPTRPTSAPAVDLSTWKDSDDGSAEKKWLRDHAETYRIQRQVWAAPAK